jgi:hypothetical protein
VLNVFLAGPDNLDRTFDMAGDLDSAKRAIAFEAATKSASDQMIMHDYLFQRQAGGFRGSRLNSCYRLRADPDFTIVFANVNRAVHRFHSRMR